MKIHPVGAKWFHADRDRWTDMMKLTVTSHNFVNMPNKMDCREIGCGKVKLS